MGKLFRSCYHTHMSECRYIIRQLLPELAPSERKIAHYLLTNPTQAVAMGVKQIAASTDSSAAACIRLAKRIGFNGYTDLRLALAQEVFATDNATTYISNGQINENSTTQDFIQIVTDKTIESIHAFRGTIDPQCLETSVDVLMRAKRICITGIGASGTVAADLKQKLSRLGFCALYSPDIDQQIVEACALNHEDVLIAISYSGETKGILKAVSEAKKNTCPVIAITRIGSNSLSKNSDIVLGIVSSESLFREGATLSRFNQLLTIDCIYAMVLSRSQDAISPLTKRSWEAVATMSD